MSIAGRRVTRCMSLLLVTSALAQIPSAQVSRIGFPTASSGGAGSVVREGQWVPVLTELQLPGSGVFEGSLRIVSEDLDGDLTEYVTSNVILNPEAGQKRYWTYAVGFERRTSPSTWFVDVLDANGAVILRQKAPLVDVLAADAMLIVDMSEQPVNKLRMIQLQSGQTGVEDEDSKDQAIQRTHYLHEMAVSFLATRDVPDRWIGFEAVDCVVWDRPNPATLSEAQLDALIEWVKRGGRLVVGLGDSWAAVRDTRLAEILPVKDVPSTASAQRLRFFAQRYFVRPRTQSPVPNAGQQQSPDLGAIPIRQDFPAPIAVGAVTTTPDAVVTFRDQIMPSATSVDLITMRCVGAGRVIACAASLRDLTTAPIDEAFFREVLDLTPVSAKYAQKLAEKQQGTLGIGIAKYPLFDEVTRRVSFQGERTLSVLAVVLFVLLYGATATLGSWWWLRRKGWTGISWTVFAGFAVVASALSLGAVGITGGLRQGVESVQLVDMVAAEREAHCFGWFGYGSALRQVVDLSVGPAKTDTAGTPEAEGAGSGRFVRGLSMPSPNIVTFATPARYTVDGRQGEARDVLVRATLKQFEGAWSGQIDGTVLGQLTADRRTGELTGASWIQNDLPVKFSGGYLLYLDPRSRGGNFDQLDRAGTVATHWRGRADLPAGMHVVSVFIPPLASGERTKADFARAQYGEVERRLALWSADSSNSDPGRPDRPDLVTLWQLQQYWANNTSTIPAGSDDYAVRAVRGLLLASTLRWYQPNSDAKDLNSVGTLVTLEGMPHVDVTHWLTRGQAVLLAWAEAPGPAALTREGRPVRSRAAMTLYRVRIPMRITGDPPMLQAESPAAPVGGTP